MAVWEQFLNKLSKDFENGVSSRLCCWLREEKNKDFRLALRTRRKALQDNPESCREFGVFLVRCLLEEPRLRPLQSRLKSLPPLFRFCSIPNGKAGRAGQLRNLLEWMERDGGILPRELLLALSDEILDDYHGSAERTDTYVELQACFLDMEQGRCGEADYLREALNLLIKRERMGLDEKSWEFLNAYGISAGGQGFFDGVKRKSDKFRLLLKLLEHPEIPEMDREGLTHLHEDILAILLVKEGRGFLYDSGMLAEKKSVKEKPEGRDSAGGTAKSRKAAGGTQTRRRKDRMMDLMDYCQEHGLSPFQNQQDVFSEGALEDYERLFENLQKTGNRNVLVPLRVDQKSGAGLYIVGRDWLPEEYRYSSKLHEKCCCYACIHFGDLDVEEDSLLFAWYPVEDDFGFPTLKEALAWYTGECLPEALEDIYAWNNGAPPPGCPVELRCYFDVGDDSLDIELTVTSDDEDRVKHEYDKDWAAYEERVKKRANTIDTACRIDLQS